MSPGKAVVIGLFCVILVGCSPSGATAGPSSSGSPTSIDVLECPPIELHDPTGDRVDLTGVWDTNDAYSGTGRVYLRQVGDCLFGSVLEGYFAGIQTEIGAIGNIHGRVKPDFTVDVVIAYLFQYRFPSYADVSSAVLRIEWDDSGDIRLQEAFEPGARAGRCIEQTVDCVPIILTPLETDAP